MKLKFKQKIKLNLTFPKNNGQQRPVQPKYKSMTSQNVRSSKQNWTSTWHRQLAILLIVAVHRPPPLAPPQGQRRELDLSTTKMGQTRRSGRWVNRYTKKEIKAYHRHNENCHKTGCIVHLKYRCNINHAGCSRYRNWLGGNHTRATSSLSLKWWEHIQCVGLNHTKWREPIL